VRNLGWDDIERELGGLNQVTKHLVSTAKKAANKYFEGYTCSEAILLSLREDGFLSFPDVLVRAATGFGAGVGLSRQMCGCLSGAVMAIGIRYGRTGPPASRKNAWDRCRHLSKVFQETFGTTSCAELTKGFNDFASNERISFCAGIIAWTVDQLLRLLDQEANHFSTPEVEAYYRRREGMSHDVAR